MNDHAADLAATLKLVLYRDGEFVVHRGETSIAVAGRSAIEVVGDALLETFADTARAYRFGPPGHDVLVASLTDEASGKLLVETSYLLEHEHEHEHEALTEDRARSLSCESSPLPFLAPFFLAPLRLCGPSRPPC